MSILDVSTAKWGFIKCKGQDLVVDINKGSASPGATVISWSKKSDVVGNQIWAFATNGSIVSQLSGLVLDLNGSEKVVTAVYNPESKSQRWSMTGSNILNLESNKVLDITGGLVKGVQLCVWPLKPIPAANQQWEFIEVATPFGYVKADKSVTDAIAAAKESVAIVTPITPETQVVTPIVTPTPTTSDPTPVTPVNNPTPSDTVTPTVDPTYEPTVSTETAIDSTPTPEGSSSLKKVAIGVSLLAVIGAGVGGYLYYTSKSGMKKAPKSK